MPVPTTARLPKKNCSKFVPRKQPPVKPPIAKNRNKNCPKPVEPPQNSLKKPSSNDKSHPKDCACPQCDSCIMKGFCVILDISSNIISKFLFFRRKLLE